MRARTLVLLAFALFAAGGTFYLAQNWIAAQRGALTRVAKQETPQNTSTVMVLVASEELSAGRFIKAKHLRWQAWPEKGLSESYYVKGRPAPKGSSARKNANDGKGTGDTLIDGFIDAVVRAKITVGEPVTDGRVVRPGDRGFLAAVLQPGTRAISVPINATTGISGFVFPGDKVDMLLTHSIQQRDETVRRATETVLSDIRVLAVDQRTDDVEGKAEVAKTATLEVTPKQAEVIAVASEMGRLSLSLRSLATEEQKTISLRKSRTFTWDTEASHLLTRRSGKTKAHVVKVFRGGTATARQFDKKNESGYNAKEAANIRPAASQTATGAGSAPKNLIGKVK